MNHTHRSEIEPTLHERSEAMLSDEQWTSIAHALSITHREMQIIQGVFSGFNEAVIAERLCISAHTVHTHLDRIYRKLNVSCRCDLVVRIFAEYIALNSGASSGRNP